ncbi:iron-containing alcohol dehydrogenase [Terriglobus albidus]|uniref:Iron-containing alcohol dehydrogenase n=1 Tax=Terriglobus albidus TaxID=1592106 RepID=A0A5B9EAN9_9BACT|nr:iron-containing alcohol dehydrogenase [Terriglobus albidus]QEE29202.1 iron-containing alcohol dehydrogenase [Terriglobus albidus]
MRILTSLQPHRIVFGCGCLTDALEYIASLPEVRIHLVSSPSQRTTIASMQHILDEKGFNVTVDDTISAEPTQAAFANALNKARQANPTCIVGLGGGSPLDVAKLLAAFLHNDQEVEDTFGINLLQGRNCHLICIPTTAGTGSEVSPNAILLDETARLKKGVISPYLVPDATFIDPELTRSLPPQVTAFTGMDALTHCIEAYTNRFAHPLVDLYALEGIRLCATFLARAVANGNDIEAREGMARASLYGGLCLGPVNTAAVHALAYPLGGEFHVPHGLSNAVLLPAVFRFNCEASPDRHAAVALALGVQQHASVSETAQAGAKALAALSRLCGLDCDLRRYGVVSETVPRMAEMAMTVTRLLRNNPREVTHADAEKLYRESLNL